MAFREGRLKVAGISGTLRDGSTGLGALRRALAASEDAGAEVEFLDLNELLISTAAYHGTLAGVTKNALDYAQFLGKEERPYFEGKVVGLVSTGGGEQAATNDNAAIVHTVHALRGMVAPLMVGVAKALRRSDDRGEITDHNHGARLEGSGGPVVELAEKLRTGETVGAVA